MLSCWCFKYINIFPTHSSHEIYLHEKNSLLHLLSWESLDTSHRDQMSPKLLCLISVDFYSCAWTDLKYHRVYWLKKKNLLESCTCILIRKWQVFQWYVIVLLYTCIYMYIMYISPIFHLMLSNLTDSSERKLQDFLILPKCLKSYLPYWILIWTMGILYTFVSN